MGIKGSYVTTNSDKRLLVQLLCACASPVHTYRCEQVMQTTVLTVFNQRWGFFPLLCLTWNNCDKQMQHLCGGHFELLFSTSHCPSYISVLSYFIYRSCRSLVTTHFSAFLVWTGVQSNGECVLKTKGDLWIVVTHFVCGCCQEATGTRPLKAPADAHLRCFYLWFCYCSVIYSCVSCPAMKWSDRKLVCG